jgi:predicted unusual protein kinase regulating ubiquinone biosynthesis (AarF/ABC1/UbiB family)
MTDENNKVSPSGRDEGGLRRLEGAEQNSIPTTKVERSAKFVKTGFKIGGNYIKHYSKKLFNPDMDKSGLNEDNAADIYQSLSELKGSALKVAQMLSMDKNLLPKAYVDKFTQSQYNAPPLSGPLIVQTFRKYFGKNPDQIFDKFNIRSNNAASIGQVHQAELNGKKLAVKIQYPGVGESISSDLKLIKPFAFRMLGMSEKELNVYMSEVEERLLEETDYELEVRRSIEFSTACANLDNVVFPIYYPELSSKRIITMDWLEGKHLKEFLATNPSQELRNQIGQALWDFYNFQQHELRAVHADPHPGNFLITPEGKLGCIDFGCIKEMPEDFYYPFFSLTSTNLLDNKEETIKAFRLLDMIRRDDTPAQVEFFYGQFKEMISLFAMPYIDDHFDFSQSEFFDQLFAFGERLSKMPEFKQARGVKHFIYVNRTNFGLYNILHELKAKVKTDTFKPHVVLEY